MEKRKQKITIYKALYQFLQGNCVPVLPGGGTIGGDDPEAIDCEIRIKLNQDGSGYMHVLNKDSDTKMFETINEDDDQLTKALEHIRHLVNKNGNQTDSLIWHYRKEALEFMLPHDKYYQKLTGKAKQEYAKNFTTP